VPLYLKMCSDGEFCEEMDWIEAAFRLGVCPVPRFFVGVPFTPHRGRRIISAAWLGANERAAVEQVLLRALMTLSVRTQLSVNVAFATNEEAELFKSAGFVQRMARQAWWTNREPEPYEDFGDFLSALRPKKARAIEKQRTGIREMEGLQVEVVDGSVDASVVSADLMGKVYHVCYVSTQIRHGNIKDLVDDIPMFDLTESFFRRLAERFAHRVLLVLARAPEEGNRLIGGSLCFAKGGNICGRYWGYAYYCNGVPNLHFECCYHALVEYAIKQRFTRVEPGNAGGQIYRVQRDRGFEPVRTPSYHLVPHPGLREEVSRLAEHAATEVPSWTKDRRCAYAPSRRTTQPLQ